MIILAAGMPRAGSGWHYNPRKVRLPQLRGASGSWRRGNPHPIVRTNEHGEPIFKIAVAK